MLSALTLLATPTFAQPNIVTSETVSDVAVTVYRDPRRDAGEMIANWPRGYALITETRTISIPAGDTQLRFENVAEGLPARNRDRHRTAIRGTRKEPRCPADLACPGWSMPISSDRFASAAPTARRAR